MARAKPKNTSAPSKLESNEVSATAGAQAPAQAAALLAPASDPSNDQAENSPLGGSADMPVAELEAPRLPEEVYVEALVITAESDGFRRAGRAWSKTPTTVPIGEFGDEQILALEQCPMIQVVYVAAATKQTAG